MAIPYDFKKVQILRRVSGLTQQQLADQLNKDRTTIARFETGVVASLDLLILYTAHFKRDYREFLLPATQITEKQQFSAL